MFSTSLQFYRIVCTVSYIASAILYYVLLRNLSSRCYGRGAYVKCSISPHCYWIAVRIVLAVYFVVIPFQPSTFKQPWESKLQIGEIYWRPRVAGSTVNSYNVYVRVSVLLFHCIQVFIWFVSIFVFVSNYKFV
jgi:hypothetical protein